MCLKPSLIIWGFATVQINHPLCSSGFSFILTGSMSLSMLFWATMLFAYQFSNLLRRNCMAAQLTLTFSGCSRSMQLGEMITYIKSLFCSKFNTLLVICLLNSSKVSNPVCFKSKPSYLLFCVTQGTITDSCLIPVQDHIIRDFFHCNNCHPSSIGISVQQNLIL